VGGHFVVALQLVKLGRVAVGRPALGEGFEIEARIRVGINGEGQYIPRAFGEYG